MQFSFVGVGYKWNLMQTLALLYYNLVVLRKEYSDF